MPFTFSHPAAVLPLDYLSKRWLSLTALVIGSLTPDFEYFLRMKVSAQYSHTWSGLFWFDVPLGLLLMLVYVIVVKDKLITHLPDWLNRRFSNFRGKGHNINLLHSVVIIMSTLIGATSHILWDSFTHPAGYFVKHHRLLRHKALLMHYHVELYNILQHLSTVIGAIAILYSIYKLPKGNSTAVGSNEILYYWLKVIGIAVLVLIIRTLTGLSISQYGDVIVTLISGFLIGLIIASASTKFKQAA